MISLHRKCLMLLFGFLLAGLAHAEQKGACDASDFNLKNLGVDGGANMFIAAFSLTLVSNKTCVIQGYTAETTIAGYRDYSGKLIPNKVGQVDKAAIASKKYTLNPNESLYFTVQFNGPAADSNPIIDTVVFNFNGIDGPITFSCGSWAYPYAGRKCGTASPLVTAGGLSFGTLSDTLPDY